MAEKAGRWIFVFLKGWLYGMLFLFQVLLAAVKGWLLLFLWMVRIVFLLLAFSVSAGKQ